MWQQGLRADAKHRKSATVVGNVLGNFHPHGDASVYDALVRMAQSFSLRYPLVDGSGNFGSLDGDLAAAYRYTECRLARLADQLLIELDQDTVAMRPNFDGTKAEPVVLPARIPNLLVNGATGIAVGMATNIPPHNLGEVCTALVKLLDNDELTTPQLCRWIKGPDFPTGGVILNTPDELKEIYRTGSGAVKLRATWEAGPGRTRLEDRLHHEHPLRDRQERPRRAHRRHRPRPQAAAAARRARRLDRRRPHRARAEAGRRREDGAGVPVQAHAAADQLQRQPHLPDSDRAGRGRPAGAPRPEGDALALPALPPRGGDRGGSSTSWPRCRAGSISSKASRRSSTPSTRSCGSCASRRARPTRRGRSSPASGSTPSRPTRSSS